MRKEILDVHPDADLEMLVVWTEVVAADDLEGARRAMGVLDDPRVEHFHDPNRSVGQDFAEWHGMRPLRESVERDGGNVEEMVDRFKRGFLVGPAAIFDTVYFYAPGVRWGESTPAPSAWVTQLDPAAYGGIDPERFRFGKEMEAELHRLGDAWLGVSDAAGGLPKEPSHDE